VRRSKATTGFGTQPATALRERAFCCAGAHSLTIT
jgi:hypothetical protein